MKRMFYSTLTFLAVFLFFFIDLSAQSVFGPQLNNYRTSLYKTGSTGTPTSRGQLGESQLTEVGKSSGTLFRALYQWNIPDDVIPDNSTIDSVRIKYQYSKVYSSTNLAAQFYRIPTDITAPNPDWADIWGKFIDGNKILEKSDLAPNQIGTIPSPPQYYNDDMPKLIDAVKKSLPENKFVLGIMSNSENINEDRYFYISTGYVEIRIYYKRPHQSVTVTQVLSTGAGYGNVGRYEGNNFIDRITGTTHSLEVGSTEYFRADTNKAIVSDEKFNYWNNGGTVINHYGFPIDSTTNSIVSHFNRIGTATVKNALEGLSSVSADTVRFKDPWLRDDNSDPKGLRNRGAGAIWQPHASPFVQDINHPRFKGVLLNQLYKDPNYYSALAKLTFDKYLPQTGKTHRFQFVDWSSTNATVSYPMVRETPVIFTGNNAEVKANYKASMLSGTQTAFSNSSQRKFILVPKAYHPFGGDMHLVYESMGKIWYEKSGDGGTTWALQNGGKPLNIDYTFNSSGIPQGTGNYTTAKHPSLDYYQDKILIVWQEQSGSNYVVKLVVVTYGTPAQATCIPFTSYGLYSEDIYPEIAVKDNGKAVIAIRRNDSILKGLEVHYISLGNVGYGMVSDQCAAKIAGTDQNTGLFTIATDRSATDKFHIAWEENYTSITNAMMYSKFYFSWVPGEIPPGGGSYQMNILKTVNVSASTAYIKCTYPTMVGANDGSCRLAFKGDLGERYSVSSCGPENLSYISYLNRYGGEVFSPQISLGSQVYFVGWTELTSGVYKTIATDSKTLRTMETVSNSNGRDMQINCNGASNQQYSLGFNSESSTLPYFFTRSVALGSIDPNKKVQITSGRGIFLTKDESQMYFILGNVTSEGVPVDFIESQDTVRLDGDLKKVNSFMTTKPFSLKDNSKLSFAVIYGTKDSTTSKSNIKDGEFASFKVDLVDDATGRVLGSYLSEKMEKGNIFKLKEGVYKISSDGIGSKLVRLRVSVDENMKSQYTISDMFFGEGLPLSKSLKEHEMGLEGSMEIKEYSLSQNYPNPFNPTTIVSYQIPKPSKVTLKIYDILGKEVATLVNGFKEIGKYSVEFNASSLPSGIYIYEIRANDFVKSGKMMLLK